MVYAAWLFNCISSFFFLSLDTYSRVEGSRTKIYDIPPLTERQKQANSVFERVGLISFSPSSLFLSLFLSHGITFLIDINREFQIWFKSTESSKVSGRLIFLWIAYVRKIHSIRNMIIYSKLYINLNFSDLEKKVYPSLDYEFLSLILNN